MPPPLTASSSTRQTQQAADESWFTALASAEASVAAQVEPLDESQRRALAIQWMLAPITGDPIQTARARWASTYQAQASSQAASASKCQALADDAFPQHFGIGQSTDQYVQENLDRQNMFNDCMAGRLP